MATAYQKGNTMTSKRKDFGAGAPDPVRVEGFHEWIATAAPGSVAVYHYGFLCHDRSYTAADGKTIVYNQPDDTLGNMARNAYEAGLVELVQERRAPPAEGFAYLAIKRKDQRRGH